MEVERKQVEENAKGGQMGAKRNIKRDIKMFSYQPVCIIFTLTHVSWPAAGQYKKIKREFQRC